MIEARIAEMPGDGIGPEIYGAARLVLDEVERQADGRFEYVRTPVAGEAYDLTGTHLPDSSIEAALETDAVLKGPFGGPLDDPSPKWQNLETEAIVGLRQVLGVYANLRPFNGRLASLFTQLSPIREKVQDVDWMFVRELTGDYYSGKKVSGIDEWGRRFAYETNYTTDEQMERTIRVGVKEALSRSGQLTLIGKKKVLTETGPLWQTVFDEVVAPEPGITPGYLNVDAAAAALVENPQQLDTIVTPNSFGDILTDEAAAVVVALGYGGSASLGDRTSVNKTFGLYEPDHGSAPDIAGKGIANPMGMIQAAAMMLRYSLGMPAEATAVEQAVGKTLDEGYVTTDLYVKAPPGLRPRLQEVGTDWFAKQVVEELRQAA